MKKIVCMLKLVWVAVFVFSLVGCGGGNSSSSPSGTTAVTVNIDNPGPKISFGGLPARSTLSIPSNVSSIVIAISAPDMERIERVVDVSGKTAIVETFKVPNGKNRHFFAAAMASDGTVLFQGDTLEDLSGIPREIIIALAFDISGEWTVTTPQDTAFLIFTQTGNSLVFTAETLTGLNTTGSGTIVGNTVQLSIPGVDDNCDNVVTATFTGTISSDGNTINGTLTKPGSCGSTEQGSATRGHVAPPPPPPPPTPPPTPTPTPTPTPPPGPPVSTTGTWELHFKCAALNFDVAVIDVIINETTGGNFTGGGSGTDTGGELIHFDIVGNYVSSTHLMSGTVTSTFAFSPCVRVDTFSTTLTSNDTGYIDMIQTQVCGCQGQVRMIKIN